MEIALETSREKRLLMLKKVPDHLQDLVRKHVEIAYERKNRFRCLLRGENDVV